MTKNTRRASLLPEPGETSVRSMLLMNLGVVGPTVCVSGALQVLQRVKQNGSCFTVAYSAKGTIKALT